MVKKQLLYQHLLVGLMVFILLLLMGCAGVDKGLKVGAPAYPGVPVVIFRMDDAEKGVYQEVVEQIIKLFEKNKVPLDVGVVPYAKGRYSYDMPYLKQYLDAGVISISVHGYEHVPMEFDTAQSGKNYRELTSNLVKARERFKKYYGIAPAAFTVPYDFLSEEGYRAIQDAGFKIISTQKAVEKHPSIEPVDYFGNKDENGMIRICTIDDVARWDNEKKKWGDIYSADLKNSLFYSIKWGLTNLGTAVVNIHPQAFVDENNVIDPLKLDKLDEIIKLSQTLGLITTFEEWYQNFLSLKSRKRN
jgi:hypothetical protein